MFAVDELCAAAIRREFIERGELAAVVELRRRFPAIIDNAAARLHVRTIVQWPTRPPKAMP